MNEKVNFQELIALLSEKAGITKKDAENFLWVFFDLISEAILSDGIVKIKNLGTFKLIDVDERESINVRTGERVLIPAHKKISYIPDNNLSQTINEPFSMFSPVDLEDQAVTEPTADQPEENNEMPEVVVDNETNEPENESGNELEDESKNELENEPEKEPEKIIIPEEDVQEKTIIAPADPVVVKTRTRKTRRTTRTTKPTRKKQTGFKSVGIIFAVAVALATLVFFALPYIKQLLQPNNPETFEQSAWQADADDASVSEAIENSTEPEDTIAFPDSNETATIADTIQTIEPEKIPDKTEPQPVAAGLSVKKRKIEPGERLTVIALQEYGDKAFWVYLYEENKRIIDNPGLVPVGLEIVIPPANKYGIDKDNPESISKAKRMAE